METIFNKYRKYVVEYTLETTGEGRNAEIIQYKLEESKNMVKELVNLTNDEKVIQAYVLKLLQVSAEE